MQPAAGQLPKGSDAVPQVGLVGCQQARSRRPGAIGRRLNAACEYLRIVPRTQSCTSGNCRHTHAMLAQLQDRDQFPKPDRLRPPPNPRGQGDHLSGVTSRRRSRSPRSKLQRIEVLDFQSPDLERIHPAMTQARSRPSPTPSSAEPACSWRALSATRPAITPENRDLSIPRNTTQMPPNQENTLNQVMETVSGLLREGRPATALLIARTAKIDFYATLDEALEALVDAGKLAARTRKGWTRYILPDADRPRVEIRDGAKVTIYPARYAEAYGLGKQERFV